MFAIYVAAMIRKFREQDAHTCSKFICKTIEQSKYLNKSQKRALIIKNSEVSLIEKSKDIDLYVWTKQNIPFGIGGLQNNRIRTFFVSPNYQKRGIGRMLVRYLEKIAKIHKHSKIVVYAAIEARIFYEKLGYHPKKILTLKINNTVLKNYLMEKML